MSIMVYNPFAIFFIQLWGKADVNRFQAHDGSLYLGHDGIKQFGFFPAAYSGILGTAYLSMAEVRQLGSKNMPASYITF
jgi:hypothetical protein